MKTTFFGVLTAASLALAASAGADTGNQRLETIPEVLIDDLRAELHLTDFQAAAIVGNLAQETGNFTMLHQIGGPGLGYSQWTGSRKTKFRNFARDTLSYRDNKAFLFYELTGPYADVLVRLRETRTLEEATQLFMSEFLRPSARHAALNRRIDFADGYLDGEFDGAGCIHSHHLGNGRLARCEQIAGL